MTSKEYQQNYCSRCRYHADCGFLHRNLKCDLLDELGEAFDAGKDSAHAAATTYICGPITGHDEAVVRRRFADAADGLRKRGLVPVSPLDNGLPWNAPWEDHVKTSLRMMLCCDGLYVLEGWEDSRGCRLEVKLARDLAMNVTFAGEREEEPSCE